MSYNRVIPRDLFNEANLLKCYGQLYLKLEELNIPGVLLEHSGEAFDVWQNPDDGSTTVVNIELMKGGDGDTRMIGLYRPMNSREPWPLYAMLDYEEVAVFNDDGSLTGEFITLLKA
jgi:hypothetical protein